MALRRVIVPQRSDLPNNEEHPLSSQAPASNYSSVQRIGLIGGALLFVALLVLPAPGDLAPETWKTAVLAVLMGVWWLTEALPIPVTALLPLFMIPMLGIAPMGEASAPYASDIIYLFMGGFFLAAAMEASGLHRRVALGIISYFGTGSERLVFGFMLASGVLSMWINNTATTAMMLPIAIAVTKLFNEAGPDDTTAEIGPGVGNTQLGICLMLGIAWASSIGGVATLIGTAPNLVLSAAAEELLGITIGFGEWLLVGLPVAGLMLPLTWLLLVKFTNKPEAIPEGAAELLVQKREALGPRSKHETLVAVVFLLTAFAWVMRQPKALGFVTVPGLTTFFPEVRDSTIAMISSMALFLLPLDFKRGRFCLEWRQAREIPWGVLILFGGGLSLARAMDQTGLAAEIGSIFSGMQGASPWLIFGLIATVFVFMTEFTSNTATSTMAMPILAGAALGLGQPALVLMATAAMSASMAFMLPVGTPPNAMVFASGYVTIPIMARAGFWLNIASIAIITTAATYLVPLLLSGMN